MGGGESECLQIENFRHDLIEFGQCMGGGEDELSNFGELRFVQVEARWTQLPGKGLELLLTSPDQFRKLENLSVPTCHRFIKWV